MWNSSYYKVHVYISPVSVDNESFVSPIVEAGTMITCGPGSPSSFRWARKAMAWIVFPKP